MSGILSSNEIMRLAGWSRSTFNRRKAEEDFPSPVNINSKPLFWRKIEIMTYLSGEESNVSKNDHTIMRTFPDLYEQMCEEAELSISRKDIEYNYSDELRDATNEALDNAYDEEHEEWISLAIEESNGDDVDLEERARTLFDEHMAQYNHELRSPAIDEIHSRINLKREKKIHRHAIELVIKQVKKDRKKSQ